MPARLGRVVLAGALAGGWGGSGGAADWSLSGLFSQRFEAIADTEGDSAGADRSGLRSVTDLAAEVETSTPTTRLQVAPGVRFLASTADADDSAIPLPRIEAGFAHDRPRSGVTASLSVVPDFVDDAQFEDTGRSDDGDFQITANGRVGGSYALDARNGLSLGLFGRLREFTGDPDNLSASRSFGVDGGWSRQLSATDSVSLSPAVTVFRTDSETGVDGSTLSLGAGFQTRPTPRLGFNASLGPSLTLGERGRGANGSEDVTDLGATGGASLIWSPDAVSRVTLGVTQNVDQNSEGDLENRLSVRLAGSYRIDPRSRLSLGASAGLQTAISGDAEDRTTFSLSPRYSLSLTEDWSLDLGYRLRTASDDETSLTNTVFLTISRGFDLAP